MSTGAECSFEEREPNRWWYRIQQWPYGETPDFDEHGPFNSFDSAYTHREQNYANPGGFSKIDYTNFSKSST